MWPLVIALGGALAILAFAGGGTPVRRVEGAFPPLGHPKAVRVSSWFGHRIDPIEGGEGRHHGIDLAAPLNTPVYAPIDAIVSRVDQNGVPPWGTGNGNAVILSGAGYRWAFLHLNLATVVPGQRVQKGQIIGFTGATGRATGPHLHLQVTDAKTGVAVDPVGVYPQGTFV